MTDAEMAEAVADAEHYLAVAGRSGLPSMATLCHALIESRRQVEALTKERDEAVAVLGLARMQRDNARDLHDKAMVAIHAAAGVARNGMCGILGWIDDAKDATARAERAEQARFDAVAIAARLEAEDYRSMPKLHQRDRTVAATERARVVEAIAAYVVHIAGRETANAMALGDGTWRVIASVCGDLADHIRSHNWAPPEEDSK